jgi:hypothetical protein
MLNINNTTISLKREIKNKLFQFISFRRNSQEKSSFHFQFYEFYAFMLYALCMEERRASMKNDHYFQKEKIKSGKKPL